MDLLAEWFEGVTDFFKQYKCMVVNFHWSADSIYFRFEPMQVSHELSGSVTVRLDKNSTLPLIAHTHLDMPRSGLSLSLTSIEYSDGYTEATFDFKS